jgi:hypothetical protein
VIALLGLVCWCSIHGAEQFLPNISLITRDNCDIDVVVLIRGFHGCGSVEDIQWLLPSPATTTTHLLSISTQHTDEQSPTLPAQNFLLRHGSVQTAEISYEDGSRILVSENRISHNNKGRLIAIQ